MNVRETLTLLWNVIFHRSAVNFASVAKAIDFVRHVIILGAVGVVAIILLVAFLGAGGIAPAVIIVVTAIVGCYALTVPEVLIIWFLGHGLVNGMPEIRIGQILVAPFSGEIELPDFKTGEFTEAGFKGLVTLARLFGHAVIALGVFAAATQVVSILMPPVPGRFGGVFSVLAGVMVFVAIAAIWPGPNKWYKRIATVAAVIQIVLGLFIMTNPISNLDRIRNQEIRNLWAMEEEQMKPLNDSLKSTGRLLSAAEFEQLAEINLRRSAQTLFSHVSSLLFGKTYPVHFEGTDTVKIVGVPDGKSRFELLKNSDLILVHRDGSLYNRYTPEKDGTVTIVAQDGTRTGGETVVRHGEITFKIVLPDELQRELTSGNLRIGDFTNQISIQRIL